MNILYFFMNGSTRRNQQKNDERHKRIRQRVANLCADPDPELVDALLDDDKLLAKSENDDPLPAMVRAFRSLHEQLKTELNSALHGHQSNDDQPFKLLSMLGPDFGLPLPQSPNKNGEERNEIDEELDESVEVISLKNDFVDAKKDNDKDRENKSKAPSPPAKPKMPTLELQFIDAVSIRPRHDDDSLTLNLDPSPSAKIVPVSVVDRSIQVELEEECGEITEKEDGKKEEKRAEIIDIEEISAATAYGEERRKEEEDKDRKNESSSTDQTTTTTTSSDRRSVGQIGMRKAARLLASRSDIKLYTVDLEGALVMPAAKNRLINRISTNSSRTRFSPHSRIIGQENGPNGSQNSSPSTSTAKTLSSPEFSSEGHEQATNRAANYQIVEEEIEVVSAKQQFVGKFEKLPKIRDLSTIYSVGTVQEMSKNEEKIEEEEEEQSTLDQVTPIPTTLELSNHSNSGP